VADHSEKSYSLPKPALRQAIKRTSRCGKVIGNNLKYDAACSPARCQPANSQSVGAIGRGACVVITPTTTVLPPETLPRRHRRASEVCPFFVFEAPQCGGSCFGEVFLSPGVGPVNGALTLKIRKLARPIQVADGSARCAPVEKTVL